jgi:peptidoglycan/LPS O-acetylase OafA/YrhL
VHGHLAIDGEVGVRPTHYRIGAIDFSQASTGRTAPAKRADRLLLFPSGNLSSALGGRNKEGLDIGMSAKRIPSLDGLRGIAILLVVLGHLAGARYFFGAAVMAPLGDLGNLGVRLFFVISGFLITRLLLKEFSSAGRISLKAFYIRRVLRIFPAFYVFIVVAILLSAVGFAKLDRRDVLYAVTYTMNYHANFSPNYSLRHLWSLSVEEQFYLLWPLTLAALAPPRAARLLVVVLFVAPVLRVALYVAQPSYVFLADTGFEGVCDALATGCLLAVAMQRLLRVEWFSRLLVSRAFPLLFAAIWIANRQREHPKFFWLLCVPFLNGALALTILRYVRAPDLPLGRLLNRQPLTTIGVLSYSLYLYQQLFLIQWRPVTTVLVTFPLNIAMAFLCAALSYQFVERPFLRLKERFEDLPERVPEARVGATLAPQVP